MDAIAEAVAAHDESQIFREAFLYHFTRPEDREGFIWLGHLLMEMWSESESHWPDVEGSALRRELAAAGADLDAAARFLRVVAAEPEASMLCAEDRALAQAAGAAHRLVRRALQILEDGLQGEAELSPEGATPCPAPRRRRAGLARVGLLVLGLGGAAWWATRR
jgi:hypothetical protein